MVMHLPFSYGSSIDKSNVGPDIDYIFYNLPVTFYKIETRTKWEKHLERWCRDDIDITCSLVSDSKAMIFIINLYEGNDYYT